MQKQRRTQLVSSRLLGFILIKSVHGLVGLVSESHHKVKLSVLYPFADNDSQASGEPAAIYYSRDRPDRIQARLSACGQRLTNPQRQSWVRTHFIDDATGVPPQTFISPGRRSSG